MTNCIIAGLTAGFDFHPGPGYQNFITGDGATSGSMLHFCTCRKDTLPVSAEAEFTVEQEQFSVSKLSDGFLFNSLAPVSSRASLYVDACYTEAAVIPGAGLANLLRLTIESRLIALGMITLHSACVDTPYGALCLTGPSGVGKSTRAAAMCKAGRHPEYTDSGNPAESADSGRYKENASGGRHISMISGDRPLLDCTGIRAYGVPWDGKEGLHVNTSAHLHSVLTVKRLDEVHGNDRHESLRILDENEAYKALVAQTFLPMWDTDLAVTAMSNLKKLISQIPVYEAVSGRDEESAVRILNLLNNI